MVILHYRMTSMFPDEYLLWLVTEGASQVEACQEQGLVAHRVFQSQQDPQEFLIIDEWEGEPQELDYFYREDIEGGQYWTSLTAGPDVTRFEENSLDEAAARATFEQPKG